MKQLVLLYSLLFCSLTSFSQSINWVDIEDVAIKMRQEAKPVMIFFYTDWCKYCELQKQTSYQDSTIIADLNEKYYCIKMNGESKETIKFLGRTYAFNVSKKEHQLVSYIASVNGQMSYPTTVFFDERFNLLKRETSYLSIDYFKSILKPIK